MQDQITPVRIANSIQQDTSFYGYYVLVEGDRDVKLFKKFSCQKSGKIKLTFGKKKMRSVYSILIDRGFDRVLGIRDADFIRLPDNEKFDPQYGDNIFLTDSHDSEMMIFQSDALSDVVSEVASEGALDAFMIKNGEVRGKVFDLAIRIGALRLANKRFGLGLAFKPVSPEGNKLKFKRFICDKKIIYLGDDVMINTVVEYSKNRGSEVAARNDVKTALNNILKADHPVNELVNGHDVVEILSIVLKKGLKANVSGAGEVERMLRLAFSREYFTKTGLYKALSQWQQDERVELF